MPSLKIECYECRGTGLYSGFMEAKGEAVVCVRCSGTGAQTLRYTEFTGRKKKAGITKVRTGSGTILDGIGESPRKWFTYQEFESFIPSK